jgi:Protein of unknown function (DUF2934)
MQQDSGQRKAARGCADGHALDDWLEAESRVGQGAAAAGARKLEAV